MYAYNNSNKIIAGVYYTPTDFVVVLYFRFASSLTSATLYTATKHSN